MQVFETSFYVDKIIISIKQNSFVIHNLPKHLFTKKALIYVSDVLNNNYNQVTINVSSQIEYNVPSLSNGLYFFNVFFESETKNIYHGYLYNRNIQFVVEDGFIKFNDSKVFAQNKVFYLNLKVGQSYLNSYLKPSSDIQSDHFEIKSLASSIIRGALNSYQKLKAIHDWVARNIYYDMDSLNSGSYKQNDCSSLSVYRTKRSVCQGYSNLSVALLRSIGIPSIGVSCFALGISTKGGWEKQENLTLAANHIITFAYVDYRWIMMDITWDSDNVYKNGKYQTKTGMGVSHKYFDTTLAFISNTHRLIS